LDGVTEAIRSVLLAYSHYEFICLSFLPACQIVSTSFLISFIFVF
jgi:hypothetical protein